MPTVAVIAFDFEPLVQPDGTVRWETLGIAAAIFLAIVVASLGARSMELRVDDLVFVVLGIVPGAVIGGRVGDVLLHPAFYAANPTTILDPNIGSLELALAVIGGALTGGLVAALLDGSTGRWFHIASLPVLLALGAGKLAAILGGRGQGQPWDGAWATAYLGSGSWGSLAPSLPAHPSQAYEGIAALAVLVLTMGVLAIPGARRPDGRVFLIALGLWAAARALVATTWRDPVVLGPLRAEQAIDLGIVVGVIIGLGVLVTRERPAVPAVASGQE